MGFIDDHADDVQRIVPILLEITTTATLRLTDYDAAIVTGGTSAAPAATWSASGFKVNGIPGSQGSAVSQVTLVLPNADNTWSAVLYSGDLIGGEVNLYAAWLDPTLYSTVSQEEVLLLGPAEIEEATSDKESVILSLSPKLNLSEIVVPRRTVSQKCGVRFKGIACAYAGATASCDHTFATCVALLNQDRYGGFPFMLPEEFR